VVEVEGGKKKGGRKTTEEQKEEQKKIQPVLGGTLDALHVGQFFVGF
jgi:hypothetical protein